MTRLPRILPFALFAAALFVLTPLPARGAHKAEVPVPRGEPSSRSTTSAAVRWSSDP